MTLLKLRLGIILFALSLPTLIRAQLVADGQTNVLSGVVSNISQQVIVGTNGSFTLLVLTNGSSLSNTTGDVRIGLNSSAQSNRVIVSGSQWFSAIVVGLGGSGNELDILDGGIVSGVGPVGWTSSASNNLVLVSGPGSTLKQLGMLGDLGSFNTLVVSNGGQVFSGGGVDGTIIAANFPSAGNSAIVTGTGSLWGNNGNFFLGYNGSSNQLLVTDSGQLTTAGYFYVGYQAASRPSLYNQLMVSNSGVVNVSGYFYVGGPFSYGGDSVTINGGTILVTNGVASIYRGCTLTLNSGLFAMSLLANPDGGGRFIFNGGTVQSGGATFGGPPFVIGDGTDTAQYTMLGGRHGFASLVISSNAVLNGSGTIEPNVSVNNGGTIAPGTNNLATIVFNSALILNPGSITLMKLNASAPTSDTLTGISNLVYGGTLQLTNVSGSYAAGQSYSLFGATNYSGAFAALMPDSPGPGLRWDTNELSVGGVLRVFSTTTPAPVVSSVAAVGGNLLMSASGGIAYDPCYLLTSTNLAAPVSDWSYITTNYFDSTGATTFTNAIPADQAQQYFRLQVN
jgi:T5SS/PEP-CTERM-associated repeat protein